MLLFVSPGGASIMDAGGENYVFWFSRTEEKDAFLDAFSKNFDFVPQMFFLFSRKVEVPWPTQNPVAWGP